MDKNITRFCVTAPEAKSRPPPVRLRLSIPYVCQRQSVLTFFGSKKKKGAGENSIQKKMRLRPSRHGQPRRRLFSLSSTASVFFHPSCPDDADKIRINITHLVAAGRKHVSSIFLKGQVAGVPRRVGNIDA